MMCSLRSLSDRNILSRTRTLVARERGLTLQVLLHLNEIERRALHLALGFPSLFAYCTRGLGYSASAAGRRIQTARCIRRFPAVRRPLASNDVNLTTVAMVSRILTAENLDTVLSRIRGRSQREVEAIVAEYQPREAIPRDRMRPIVVMQPNPGDSKAACAHLPGEVPPATAVPASQREAPHACEKSDYSRSGSDSDSPAEAPAGPRGPDGDAAVRFAKLMRIEFSASEEFVAKFEKVRSLASHRLPAKATFEDVFELAMDVFIQKEDPLARQERRERRAERDRCTPAGAAGVTAPTLPRGARDSSRNPRHVPQAVRDQVFARDKGCCTYTAGGGRRCASTHALQIDHITPVARGGASTPANLRLLCAYHNRLEAERLLGASRAPRSGINDVETRAP
jgi:5-methylcytosine-specific restriction endonuclease McrA